jgi:hypothetical protein
LLLVSMSSAAEHLIEEAKLRRDDAREGDEEECNEAHRIA